MKAFLMAHPARPRQVEARLWLIPRPEAAGIWPSGHVGSLVLTTGQGWETGSPTALDPIGPSSSCLSLPPTVASGPCARAHGVKSLPVSLCSKLFSKRGREWFSCYQHGFWALGNALPLLPAPCHKGTFCSSPGPSLWLFSAPHPPQLPPPHASCPTLLHPWAAGVTVAWPCCPPSSRAPREEKGPWRPRRPF